MPTMWYEQARPPLDSAAAAYFLRRCLPPERRGRLIPLGKGDHCIAFRESTRVFRVARHAEAAAALRGEVCVLADIADRLPLPVPRPILCVPDDGPSFTEHEGIRGEVLTRDLWLDLPEARRECIAAELAAFIAALHDLPPEVGRRCGLDHIEAETLARSLRARAPTELYPLLDPPVRHRLDDLLVRCSAGATVRRGSCLLHRDIAPGHVFFDRTTARLTGIIDFGDVAVGDPARDFIYVYDDFGPEILVSVLAHYPREPAATILPRIRLWYLLEAAAWTIRMHEARNEAEWREGLGLIRRELGGPDLDWSHLAVDAS
jgi:aminoglycoside 2''-phosphotransferase